MRYSTSRPSAWCLPRFVAFLALTRCSFGNSAKDSSSFASGVYHPDILTDTATEHVIPLTHWNLSSTDHAYTNLSATGVVPGDVLSILLQNDIIFDPYHDRNFLLQRHIWMGIPKEPDDGHTLEKQWNRTWIYTTTFETPNSTDLSWKLILEGIKMGADIIVNGIPIAQATDQAKIIIWDLQQEVASLPSSP